jgi:hypothetical protein
VLRGVQAGVAPGKPRRSRRREAPLATTRERGAGSGGATTGSGGAAGGMRRGPRAAADGRFAFLLLRSGRTRLTGKKDRRDAGVEGVRIISGRRVNWGNSTEPIYTLFGWLFLMVLLGAPCARALQ